MGPGRLGLKESMPHLRSPVSGSLDKLRKQRLGARAFRARGMMVVVVVEQGRAEHLTRYSKIKTSHFVSPTAYKVMIFRGSSFLHLCPPPQHPLESSRDPGGQAFVPVTQQIEEGSKLSQGWQKLPVSRESKLELLLHDPDPAGLRKPQHALPQPPFTALGPKIGWLRDL